VESYCTYFSKLNRAPGPMWGEATKRRAPHKPILLLAVLDLVHRGVITSPFISISGDLVELNELFNLYWQRVVPIGQTSSIAFPFSRLDREPFWELIPVPGKSITPAVINNTSAVSYLRKYALGAKLDDDLFAVMSTETGRELLREALLQSCFSPLAQVLLREQSCINREAFDYGNLLERQAHQQMVEDPASEDAFRPAARSQGFRRSIIRAYDHRCALCGVRIITPDQQTAVDAAHIVPWSVSKNDDIRNGMALCKLCHWAFDRGMIGVDNDYSVMTSRHISSNSNVPGFLTTLSGRGIITPAEKDLWPGQQYLTEHRKEWRL